MQEAQATAMQSENINNKLEEQLAAQEDVLDRLQTDNEDMAQDSREREIGLNQQLSDL